VSWPTALISLIIVNARPCDAETSGEYLQKVMIELQELNVPSNSLTLHDRLSMNLDYPHTEYQGHVRPDNTYRKLSSDISAHQDINHQDTQKPTTSVPVDLTHSAVNNIMQYYAVSRTQLTKI